MIRYIKNSILTDYLTIDELNDVMISTPEFGDFR